LVKHINIFMKKIQLLVVTLMITALFSCQKDSHNNEANKSTEIAKKSDSNISNPNLATINKSVNSTLSIQTIKNCGVAKLIAPGSGDQVFPVGTILSVNLGETIPSFRDYGGSNGKFYRLIMQADGNLVIYPLVNGQTQTSIWHSASATTGADKNLQCQLILQSDGNLVIHARRISPLSPLPFTETWASHQIICSNQNAPVLSLQADGNIVEKYLCNPINGFTYGFVGATGTNEGITSNHPGQFQ
jgi:hypothetical protein